MCVSVTTAQQDGSLKYAEWAAAVARGIVARLQRSHGAKGKLVVTLAVTVCDILMEMKGGQRSGVNGRGETPKALSNHCENVIE